PERRNRLGPNDPGAVVARFYYGGNQSRKAYSIRAALQTHELAVRSLNLTLHLCGIFGAEEKDVAHFDSARGEAARRGYFALEQFRVVHLARCRVFVRPCLDPRPKVPVVVGVL